MLHSNVIFTQATYFGLWMCTQKNSWGHASLIFFGFGTFKNIRVHVWTTFDSLVSYHVRTNLGCLGIRAKQHICRTEPHRGFLS
jgi:hypothetical protein